MSMEFGARRHCEYNERDKQHVIARRNAPKQTHESTTKRDCFALRARNDGAPTTSLPNKKLGECPIFCFISAKF